MIQFLRTERMLSQTRKLEITTTSNESEALLLEANLIKKHKPKFNILYTPGSLGIRVNSFLITSLPISELIMTSFFGNLNTN